ncbi:MAG TPA: hypothetical protein VF939_18210 [Puia sp.]
MLLCLLGVLSVKAQPDFWNSPNACLGQRPPSDTPRLFARDLLAKKDTFALDRVAFSDDGEEFYYPTNNTWYDSKNGKIRTFKYEGGKWKGPFILNEHYYAPTFSMDGKTLYFLGGKGDGIHSNRLLRPSRRPRPGAVCH